MKIIFITRSLNCGGAERQLVLLAKGLHQDGYPVTVAVFYPGGPLQKDLDDSGIPVVCLKKRGRWDMFHFLWYLIRTIRHERPTLIYSFLGIPNILAVMLKPLFPHIHVVWGVRASNMDLAQYDWLSRLSYRVECRLSRFADLIIVNSYAGKDHAVANGFPSNKMIVIPNGIDTEYFRLDRRGGERVRRAWGVAENEKLIGLVARLDPMKDHPTFLRAAAILSRERADVKFVCVGDGPGAYSQKLHELAHQLGLDGRLIWAGARNDMPAVYNALDILSSSSYGEGFSNVIAEAMACGVPCVVTDVGDSHLIVGNEGQHVPPKNAELLAGAVLTQLALNNRGIVQRNRIVSEYSLAKLCEKTEEIVCLYK